MRIEHTPAVIHLIVLFVVSAIALTLVWNLMVKVVSELSATGYGLPVKMPDMKPAIVAFLSAMAVAAAAAIIAMAWATVRGEE